MAISRFFLFLILSSRVVAKDCQVSDMGRGNLSHPYSGSMQIDNTSAGILSVGKILLYLLVVSGMM